MLLGGLLGSVATLCDFSCSSYSHKLYLTMQCCLGGEVPKSEVLSSIYRELEDCKKSLSSYLLSKRQVW